jgi:L-lactate permease
LTVLDRWGGWLVRPRAQAAEVRPGDARRDVIALAVLYMLGTSVYPIVEAFASLWALRDVNALLPFASAIGRVVLAPLLVLVAVETVLGSARSYQRAIGLLPLVIVGTAAHAARQLGISIPGGPYVPDIVGGLLGVALAWWIRDCIEPLEEERR